MEIPKDATEVLIWGIFDGLVFSWNTSIVNCPIQRQDSSAGLVSPISVEWETENLYSISSSRLVYVLQFKELQTHESNISWFGHAELNIPLHPKTAYHHSKKKKSVTLMFSNKYVFKGVSL